MSEFKGWRQPITRRCKTCGDIKTVTARCLIEKDKNGQIRSCAKCQAKKNGKNLRKSHEQFIEEMKNINANIEFLDKYVTNNIKIKCRCSIDGYEWAAKPHCLLRGVGCPECARKFQNRRNEKEFLEEFASKQPNIMIMSKFTKCSHMMKFKCKICEYEWKTQASIPLARKGYGCPKCKNHAPVSEKEFIKRLTSKNKYVEYIDGYIDMLTHANFKCKKCGHIWDTIPTSVLRGKGCPRCNMSMGEKMIEYYFKKNKIDYVSQYIFDDCRYIRPLPFDFYAQSKNLCIEYDGIEHFEPTKFRPEVTDEEVLIKYQHQLIRDKIKNNYCNDNNINLLRIPYTELSNIDSILNKYFS